MARGYHMGHAQFRRYIDGQPRIKATDCKSLYNSDVGAQGYFTWPGGRQVYYKVRHAEGWDRVAEFSYKGVKTPAPILKTKQYLGERYWLVCGACLKRRTALYFNFYNQIICRECAGLHYACQSERPAVRIERKIRKKRLKLWGPGQSLLDSSQRYSKPKWKRWHTFEKEKQEVARLEYQWIEMLRESDFGLFF